MEGKRLTEKIALAYEMGDLFISGCCKYPEISLDWIFRLYDRDRADVTRLEASKLKVGGVCVEVDGSSESIHTHFCIRWQHRNIRIRQTQCAIVDPSLLVLRNLSHLIILPFRWLMLHRKEA